MAISWPTTSNIKGPAISIRATLRRSLHAAGLLAASRQTRRFCAALAPSQWPTIRRRARAFDAFRDAFGLALRDDQPRPSYAGARTALLVSTPSRPLDTQVWLVKALALAGLTPVVLLDDELRHLRRYYRLAGAKHTYLWGEFSDDLNLAESADEVVRGLGSIENLISHEYAGARVGQAAASTAMRQLHAGTLDLADRRTRGIIAWYLTAAMSCATAAQRIMAKLRPEVAIIADCDYTPLAPIFDVCLAHAVDVISYDATHRSNALIFKRHAQENRSEHRSSLSDASWKMMRESPWSAAFTQELQHELESGYQTRDWYGQGATQFKCRHYGSEELRNLLGLESGKKTAFLFPHISWDAPYAWGTQLFKEYDDWLVQTVGAACLNDRVNWVVKFHPANVKKSTLSGKHRGEPAELVTLRKHFGTLPPHVSVMPADTHVSTHSLLAVVDYCLTVRGTIGLEAAVRGIPVLTGGTGRYDRRGFTIDSDSREQYLERISQIDEIPRLTPGQQELAQRYAYCLFIRRPLRLSSMTLRFSQGGSEFEPGYVRIENRIEAKSRADWTGASDIEALTRWVNDSAQTDFLMPEA